MAQVIMLKNYTHKRTELKKGRGYHLSNSLAAELVKKKIATDAKGAVAKFENKLVEDNKEKS